MYKKVILLGVSLMMILLVFFYTLKKEQVWSEITIEGKKYRARIIEFKNPVWVGVDSPPLPQEAEGYLKTYSIATNPIIYPYATAIEVASHSMKSAISEEGYLKMVGGIGAKNLQFFQQTVCYLVEISTVATSTTYLIIAYRQGFQSTNAGSTELFTLSPMIFEDGQWKTFRPDQEFTSLNENIRFSRKSEVEQKIKTKLTL